jgi:sulfite reductase (ferredoxin)
MKEHLIDLRGIACPMNFVKTKLYLDKLSTGDILKVYLDPGEPVESVCQSIQAEGHEIQECLACEENYFQVTIVKS